MIALTAVAWALPCTDAQLEAIESVPEVAYTVRGTASLMGQTGTFVQHIDGARFHSELHVGAYHDIDVIGPGFHDNQDANGRVVRTLGKQQVDTLHRLVPWPEQTAACTGVLRAAPGEQPVSVTLTHDPPLLLHQQRLPCTTGVLKVRRQGSFDTAFGAFPQTLNFATSEPFLDVEITSVALGVPPGVFERLHPTMPALDGATRVPLKLHNGQPYVEVEVEGPLGSRKGWMLFDTGWETTTLYSATLDAIGWEADGERRARGVAGTVHTRSGRIQALRLGSMEVQHPYLTRMDRPEDTLGVFGSDLMKNLVAELDYAEGWLTLSTPEAFEPPGGAAEFPSEWRCGIVSIPTTVGPYSGLWQVDTGAYTSLRRVPEANLKHESQVLRQAKPSAVNGVGGVNKKVFIGTVSDASLGPHRVKNPPLALAAVPEGVEDTAVQGLLGTNLLRCFTLTLDFDQGRVYLLPVGDLDTCAAPKPRRLMPTLFDLFCMLGCVGPPFLLLVAGIKIKLDRRRRLRQAGFS